MTKYLALAISATALCLAACSSGPAPRGPAIVVVPSSASSSPNIIRPSADLSGFALGDIGVGLIVPLTGPQARLGEALVNATQLAMFQAYDPRLKLKIYDSAGNPEQASAAAEQALRDGAQIILGPLFASSVQAVATKAQAAGVPVLAFSNDRRVAQPGVFILGLDPAAETARVVAYAAGEKSLRNIAVLVPRSAYGDTALMAAGNTISELDANLFAAEVYEPDPQALSQPVRRLADYDRRHRWLIEERQFLQSLNDDLARELLSFLEERETYGAVGYDAILIAEGGQLLRTLAPLLPIYDVLPEQTQYLGTGLFNDQGLRREPPLHGAWFAAPDDQPFANFVQRYEAQFGRPPPRISGLAFDAMALVALRARHPVASERFSLEGLTNPNGFSGAMGLFRLKATGQVERGLAIMEIAPEGIRIVDPAPRSFVDQPVISFAPKAAQLSR